MLQLILLVSTIVVTTAGFLNWQEIGDRYHERGAHSNHQLKWLFSRNQEHKESKYEVCRSKECFKIASEFWESMNKSVDPCNDFYDYACGSWKIYNPIPPSEMTWSPLHKMQKAVDYKIRELLEESVHPDDALAVKQVKKFYQSCMNIDAIENLGIKPLEAILVRNGGWPMIMEPGEWDPEEFTWQQIHDYYSHLSDLSALYKISVTRDSRGNYSFEDFDEEEMKMAISIDLPSLPSVVTMSEESFDRNKMYEDGSYAKFITEVAMIFATGREAHIDKKLLAKDINDMIELEKLLDDRDIYQDYKSVYYTFDELQEFYDNETKHSPITKINWRKTITDIFTEANIELDGDEIIEVSPLKFLSRLPNLLQKISPRTIVNYIHWHFLSNMLPYTNSKIQELEYEIKKTQAGVKEEAPRWKTCVDNINMKHAVSYLFIKKYFQEEMRTDTEKLLSAIKKEIAKQILSSDWLDDRVRKMELEKIKKMQENIGYPKWYNNVTLLNNHYRGLPTGHDFFSNILSYKKYRLKRNLKNLKIQPRKDEWYIHPIVVNALYSPDDNAFTVPAADFQLPFYTTTQLQAINYGALGMVISHEISHGFDDTGHTYDQNGHHVNWPNEIEEKYEKKVKCFVNHYNKFYEDLSRENTSSNSSEEMDFGNLKLGENMADSLGLEAIFGAFENQESGKKQFRLPGFEELSNEQLFFLNFAKIWCENSTPEFDKITATNSHSRPRYRVISSLQNSEGFAEAYNCPVGSRMNPELKCKLWK